MKTQMFLVRLTDNQCFHP